jgi:hypothetical protein
MPWPTGASVESIEQPWAVAQRPGRRTVVKRGRLVVREGVTIF